jgi:hypothetical protein
MNQLEMTLQEMKASYRLEEVIIRALQSPRAKATLLGIVEEAIDDKTDSIVEKAVEEVDDNSVVSLDVAIDEVRLNLPDWIKDCEETREWVTKIIKEEISNDKD